MPDTTWFQSVRWRTQACFHWPRGHSKNLHLCYFCPATLQCHLAYPLPAITLPSGTEPSLSCTSWPLNLCWGHINDDVQCAAVDMTKQCYAKMLEKASVLENTSWEIFLIDIELLENTIAIMAIHLCWQACNKNENTQRLGCSMVKGNCFMFATEKKNQNTADDIWRGKT